MAYDEELAERIRDVTSGQLEAGLDLKLEPKLDEKRMFGGAKVPAER